MKRDYEKETKWQKEKYKKFNFSIDKAKGEAFIEKLSSEGIKPVDWFRFQVDNMLGYETTKNTTAVSTVVDELSQRIEKLELQINQLLKNVETTGDIITTDITNIEEQSNCNVDKETETITNKKPSLSKIAHILHEEMNNGKTTRELAAIYGCSHSTIAKVVKAYREKI